ncbi:hypothetical protein Droror1_Dr00010770 [Drosera rotundifolia]
MKQGWSSSSFLLGFHDAVCLSWIGEFETVLFALDIRVVRRRGAASGVELVCGFTMEIGVLLCFDLMEELGKFQVAFVMAVFVVAECLGSKGFVKVAGSLNSCAG